MLRNELLHRLPTAGLTRELAERELAHALAMLIRSAEELTEEERSGHLPSERVLRECAAAGTWVVRWQDALERLHELERH